MYYYCDRCGVIDEDDVERKLISKAIYYPNDLAQPAEYDDPTCPSCGNYVCDYQCDTCFVKGNEDDEILLVDEKLTMTCHRCFTKEQVDSWLFDLHENIMIKLTSKFGFTDNNETHQYAEELIKKALKERITCENTAKTS